ncbi:hypothetical protein [Solimonas variicoloris]|uniref:hypothetical protein n=1 Tax=Solimonas variicoloris TaxID=254408 RepID=UPI0003650449|nr:hypothetical protein [Solimonas variicoloris]
MNTLHLSARTTPRSATRAGAGNPAATITIQLGGNAGMRTLQHREPLIEWKRARRASASTDDAAVLPA